MREDWHDPLKDYHKKVRRELRFKRFLRERLIWWAITIAVGTAVIIAWT